MKTGLLSSTLSVLIVGGTLVPAYAQMNSREAISLQNQLTEMRQELNQLQLQSSGSRDDSDGGDSDDDHAASSSRNGLVAQLLQRINELEEQQRNMRGELDDLKYKVEQQTASINKQISDMNFAAQQKSGGDTGAAAGAAGAVAGSTASSLGTVSAPPPSPSTAPERVESPFKAAEASLSKRDYAAAETYAQQGLSSARSATAQAEAYYLLGRAYSGQKDYGQAAVSYYKSYSKAPKSLKAQHALVGLSLALLDQKSKRESCQALAKLRAEFPNMSPSVKSAEMAVRKRAGCS